jgi:hypothetical protein
LRSRQPPALSSFAATEKALFFGRLRLLFLRLLISRLPLAAVDSHRAGAHAPVTSDHLRRLTANTCKDGLLGNMYRAKYTTSGPYAGNTNVRIDLMTDGLTAPP